MIDLVSRLPWWLGLLLAIVSYVALHAVAVRPMPAWNSASTASNYMAMMVRGTAVAGQYILPLICVAGAAVSAWRRRQRRRLMQTSTGNSALNLIDGLTWQQFERLIGEAFRRRGYAVTETGGGGPDGGIDLLMTKNGERYLVQCKQWRALRVGVDVVREMYGVMAARGVAGGFVVTSGRFTDEAFAFASGRNVALIDGGKLRSLLDSARQSGSQATTSLPDTPHAEAAVTAPSCPVCSKGMVLREAKRGMLAGSSFWGCSSYPSCRGTRPASIAS